MQVPFVRARWFTSTSRRNVDLVVMHDMEAEEKGDTAERVARYFAVTATKASAHYCVDNNSVVQSVLEKDVAYAAPGANHNGIHVELAGYARQNAHEWDDEYSHAMLSGPASDIVKDICNRWKIPVTYLDAAALKRGERGITTHFQVSLAFRQSDHSDPGNAFPMLAFIDMVRGPFTVPENRPVVNAPVVGILTHPSWGDKAYIEIGADGGTFSMGGAPNYGSTGNVALNKPVVGGAVTSTGKGYWLVAQDGGVFPFGDAEFAGTVEWRG